VAIAVRAHPTIELLEDRLYVVSCGRAGFQNSRNEVSVVMLKVSLPSNQERKVTTVLEGSKYNLRAEVLDHDGEWVNSHSSRYTNLVQATYLTMTSKVTLPI
jgi:hypothetical protein